MIFQKLRLFNYCQHLDTTLNFVPGLNMLVGPNGSGKTNTLRGLQFLLIGDAGGERNKLDDIRQGSTGSSYVEGEVVHDGAQIELCRGLRNMPNAMRIGSAAWSGITEINTELMRRLGTTKKHIQDYIFVGQRKIDEMFDQKPSERAASLANLFGLEHAEKVWKSMGDFVTGIEVPTTAINADKLQHTLKEYERELAAVELAYAKLGLPEDCDAHRRKYQRIVDDYKAKQALAESIETVQAEHATKLRSFKQSKIKSDQVAADMKELDAAILELQPSFVRAKEGMDAWKAYEQMQSVQKQFDADYKKFCMLTESVEPVKPKTAELTSAEQAALHGLVSRAAVLSAAITEMSSFATVCKTCGQTMPNAEDRIAHLHNLQNELATVDIQMQSLAEREADWNVYTELFNAYVRERDSYVSLKQQLDARREALDHIPMPEDSKDYLSEIIYEGESYVVAYRELEKVKAEQDKAIALVTGETSQLQKRLDELTAAYDKLKEIPEREYKLAVLELDTLYANQKARTSFIEQRARLTANMAAVQQQLDDVREITERNQRTKSVISHLSKVRQVFHRNEAPRLVSYTYIEAMLSEVNNALELFDAPFRVEMDEYLGFNARFLDGVRVQPDKRLSVGERIVLALAFRITVNSTFAGQVGVLIMDEPTAGLDEHNLGCLPRALERLRDLSHERGLQVLFVTHEPRISHLFDNTISLQAA